MINKVSIIVPVYNAQKYIIECIESILNQTYKEIELILVNDGSKDESLKICKEYQDKDARVKVIDKENEGVSIARNVGIKEAQGQYIAFVDSDDILIPEAIEILVDKINKYPDVTFVVTIPKMIFPDGRIVLPIKQDKDEEIYEQEMYRKLLYLEKTNVACWGKLFRSEHIKKYSFPEHKVNEDFYMLYQMTKVKLKVLSIKNNIYNYMIRDNSLSSIHSSRKDAVENALECMQYEEMNEGLKAESQSLFFIQSDYYFDKIQSENRKKENRLFLSIIKKNLRQRMADIISNEYLYGKQKIRLLINSIFY